MGEIGKILVFLVFYENFEEKPEKPIIFSEIKKIKVKVQSVARKTSQTRASNEKKLEFGNRWIFKNFDSRYFENSPSTIPSRYLV